MSRELLQRLINNMMIIAEPVMHVHAGNTRLEQFHSAIKEAESALAQPDELELYKKGLYAVESLIAESDGVSGLHSNGDIATWKELREGGRFEDWLYDFDVAIDAAHSAQELNQSAPRPYGHDETQ